MLRQLLFLLIATVFIFACNNYESHDELDEEGFRTVYQTDPETGEIEGTLKQYLPNGTLLKEENYVAGKLEGARQVYYEDGKLLANENYRNGAFDGAYINYYADGQPKQRGNYTEGEMAGKWLGYYKNGALREEVTFSENEEEGPFREWYDNGRPKASGTYVPGAKEDGILHLYTTSGELEKVMNCEVGLCRTSWTPDSTFSAPEAPDMTMPNWEE
ncbi:hypothetical protein A3850_007915 [Lewinella sp. 4G2]|nr:hypothetical protein A3850_007915 [Lewinella sp. 4G2]